MNEEDARKLLEFVSGLEADSGGVVWQTIGSVLGGVLGGAVNDTISIFAVIDLISVGTPLRTIFFVSRSVLLVVVEDVLFISFLVGVCLRFITVGALSIIVMVTILVVDCTEEGEEEEEESFGYAFEKEHEGN